MIEIIIATVGKDNTYYHHATSSLAWLYMYMNRLAEAEKASRESLTYTINKYGEESPNTAGDLNQLTTLLIRENKLDEAEVYLNKSLQLNSKSEVKNDTNYLIACNNEAEFYQAKKDFAKAKQIYLEQMHILEEKGLKGKRDWAVFSNKAGHASYDLEHWEEAAKYISDSLEYFEQIAPNLPANVRRYTMYAEVLEKLNRQEEAAVYKAKGEELEAKLEADKQAKQDD
jgi:tetratricopeptide (TPR) repeat protein